MSITKKQKKELIRKINQFLKEISIENIVDKAITTRAIKEADLNSDDFLLAKKMAYVYGKVIIDQSLITKEYINEAEKIFKTI